MAHKVLSLVAAAAFALSTLSVSAAGAITGDGPNIPNPPIAEGKLPSGAKGMSVAGTDLLKGKDAKSQAMGKKVRYSDRCFVTRVDYCEMDGYAPVGSACICTDGYYYYDGIVY